MASQERRILSARRLCTGRSRRREEFPEELFSDWAWSMLILTYIRQHEGPQRSICELCDAARVTVAVGERWLRHLEREGLVAIGDTVRLTPSATGRLDRYMDSVIGIASEQAPI